MARVYAAYDPRFERIVAVKVLPREFLHEPEFIARFTREAKTIAALEHPAIVPVYDYGEDGGQPYLVMRHMRGGSLEDRLKKGPLSIEESATILQRLGSALDRAHSRGIIHRDLKPSNILFDQYNNAYLADFGIVHLATSDSVITASGSLVGTPTYMSPEQVYGDKELDGRSDIYALGIILFQMLTGKTPYSAETPAKMMMKHVLEPVPDILEVRPDLPIECDQVIHKALAKEREERFPTATDMSEALAAVTKRVQRPDIKAITHAQKTMVTTPPHPPPATGGNQVPIASAGPKSATTGPRVPLWILGIVAAIVLICLALSAAAVWLINTDQLAFLLTPSPESPAVAEASPQPTTTPSPTTEAVTNIDTTATAVAGFKLTSVVVTATTAVEREVTATAAAATLVAERNANEATRVSAIAARETAAASPDRGVTDSVQPLLFGPENGELRHDADALIESVNTHLEVRDFVAQVTFDNPYAAAENGWDIGLIFRQADADEELRLVIRSSGIWNLNNRHGNEDNFIEEGNIKSYLDLTASGSNELLLVAQDGRGFLFLNGSFVTLLDLSARTNAGDIAIGTGFYGSDEHEGAVTRYERFTVWPLKPAFGPLSDQLDHVGDGLVALLSSGSNLVNFIADAVFHNPYPLSGGSWDAGFSFRDSDTADQFWLIVESGGAWSLIDRRGENDVFVDEGFVENLDTSPDGVNRLTLLALNDIGYFFLNDAIISRLNLSDRPTPGDVTIVTAFFVGDEIAGETTEYENFTVWPLP